MPDVVLSPEEKEDVSAYLHSLFDLPEEETPAPATATPLAKFCSGCGHKYASAAGNFCEGCGIKRTS